MLTNVISRAALLSLTLNYIPGQAVALNSSAGSVLTTNKQFQHGRSDKSIRVQDKLAAPLIMLASENINSLVDSPDAILDQSTQTESTAQSKNDREHCDQAPQVESPLKPLHQGAEPAGESLAPTFKYVGNSFSSKFHRPSCPFAKCISAWHLELFAQRHDATDQGYKPCRYCLPQSWTSVHAVLLNGGNKRAAPARGDPASHI
jgi:hypothetical protein